MTTGALLVPFTPTSEGLTLAFTVNGTPVEAVIPTSDIAKVEAGHRYSVKVTMKANSMQVTGVDMIPWDEVGVGGDDYTWNSLTHASVADNAAWAYNASNDPCTKVAPAGTWRTPTKENFEKAIAAGSFKGTYTINGVDVPGYYLGTSTQPAKGEGDKYLFLPQAGGGNQGSFYDFETMYWSSTEGTTVNTSNNLMQTAYRFNNGSVGEFNKSHVAAVRCVKGVAMP